MLHEPAAPSLSRLHLPLQPTLLVGKWSVRVSKYIQCTMANTTTITGSLPFTWPLPYTFPVTRILSESCTHVNKVGLVVGRANHDGLHQLHLHIHHIKRLTAYIPLLLHLEMLLYPAASSLESRLSSNKRRITEWLGFSEKANVSNASLLLQQLSMHCNMFTRSSDRHWEKQEVEPHIVCMLLHTRHMHTTGTT